MRPCEHAGGRERPPGRYEATRSPDAVQQGSPTFSFRFRVDEGEMNVRDVKGVGFAQLRTAVGRYKKQPTPPKAKDK